MDLNRQDVLISRFQGFDGFGGIPYLRLAQQAIDYAPLEIKDRLEAGDPLNDFLVSLALLLAISTINSYIYFFGIFMSIFLKT